LPGRSRRGEKLKTANGEEVKGEGKDKKCLSERVERRVRSREGSREGIPQQIRGNGKTPGKHRRKMTEGEKVPPPRGGESEGGAQLRRKTWTT